MMKDVKQGDNGEKVEEEKEHSGGGGGDRTAEWQYLLFLKQRKPST
jgi:hypothetical protein